MPDERLNIHDLNAIADMAGKIINDHDLDDVEYKYVVKRLMEYRK